MTQATPTDVPLRPPLRLDPGFMGKLDRLDLVSRKLLQGKMKGERRGKRRGQSVEFADFRTYVPGDDLRFIDWNVYARLEKLFLKLFLEEEDLALYLIVDTSGSTDYGEPHKLDYIRRVVAALGYVGLVNYNRVHVAASGGDGVVVETGGLRGRRAVPRMLDFVDKLRPAGTGDLAAACRRFALRHRTKGVCVVLSDFLDKGGVDGALRYLGGRFDLFALHVLSPQELDPPFTGDLRLVDVEDGDHAEVSISRPLLERYKANLDAYCATVRAAVVRRGGTYLLTSTDTPFESLVLNTLRRHALVG